MTVDGKTVSGRALSLNVIAPEPQDLVVPEIQIDRDKVYPTQPFEVTLRVLVRPLPDDPDRDPLSPLRRRPPHIDTNWVDLPAGLSGDEKSHWLEKFLAENGSGFTLNDLATRSGSFFGGTQAAVFNLYHGRERRNGLDGQPVNYFVYELKRKITGEKTGTYVSGPAVVKGSFVDGKGREQLLGRRLVAVAPAVSVEVERGPHAASCDILRWDRRLRPDGIRQPDRLARRRPAHAHARHRARSRQRVARFDLGPGPLGQCPRSPLILRSSTRIPTGRKEGNVKRFEYALRPKRAGVGFPAVAVTVFNPDSESFSEIATSPIALDVSAASRLDAGDLVGSLGGSGTPEIKSRAQGIFQNVTDLSELHDERVSVGALARSRNRCLVRSGVPDRGGVRASSQVGRRGLAATTTRAADGRAQAGRGPGLLADGRSTDALRAARSAVVGLIADMRNIVAEGLTASEADAALAQTAVPRDERAAVSRLLESIELAEYGSGVRSEAPGDDRNGGGASSRAWRATWNGAREACTGPFRP